MKQFQNSQKLIQRIFHILQAKNIPNNKSSSIVSIHCKYKMKQSGVFSQTASRLLQECSQTMQNKYKTSTFADATMTHLKKSKSSQTEQTALNSELPQLSPQQEEENDRIIQKLKYKSNKNKKKEKQQSIKTTQLGENQLIFTQQQLQRLKEIDENELLGLNQYKRKASSPSPIKQITLYQQQNENQDIRKSSPSHKYVEVPNKNTKEEILQYLNWIGVDTEKKALQEKKSKILKFYHHETGFLNKNHTKEMQGEPGRPVYSLMHKSQPMLKTIPFSQKAKKCLPLYNKTSADKSFLKSLPNGIPGQKPFISVKESLTNICQEVNNKIEKQWTIPKKIDGKKKARYFYMTEERKQALYECQVLRRVKSQLGMKVYRKLQLTFDQTPQIKPNSKERQQSSPLLIEDKQNNNILKKKGKNPYYGLFTTDPLKGNEKHLETQADKILSLNYERIKDERKRVIEKLVC